ncbi:hypothetical protein CULT_2730002 [[Clostridium] ultunense Esp]|nr:hypothetical protein CULT_2730002 [[Clostridium] ultunense Esp]
MKVMKKYISVLEEIFLSKYA